MWSRRLADCEFFASRCLQVQTPLRHRRFSDRGVGQVGVLGGRFVFGGVCKKLTSNAHKL